MALSSYVLSVSKAAALVEYASSAPFPFQSYSLPANFLLSSGKSDYLKLINEAADVLKQIKPLPLTPLFYAPVLSQKFKCNVFLKREDLQPVFSFKIRGAFNCMSHLESGQKVVTASAGNHAQGVAFSSSRLKLYSRIYMPINTPQIKIDSVNRLGGEYVEIVLVGNDFDEAKKAAEDYVKEHPEAIFVPPFDNDYVIAGQGTIGIEIVDEVKKAKEEGSIAQDYANGIFAPIGGGGLLSGITAYIKLAGDSRTQVYGAGGINSRSMYESLRQGHVVEVPSVDLFPDGTAVRRVGDRTFAICNEYLTLENIYNDVTNDELCAAIQDIFDETRSIAEPSGALALAALKQHLTRHAPKSPDEVYVAVISGANMDFETLRFVSERAELGAKKEAFLRVAFSDPLKNFPEIIKIIQTRVSGVPRNITELVFRHNSSGDGHAMFSFNVDPKTGFVDDTTQMIGQLQQHGFTGADLFENLLARDHVRYMVGGRAAVDHEQLLSFSFPERPGSLSTFLGVIEKVNATLSDVQLSLTLFHYRFYGGDLVNVLVGIQVPEGAEDAFKQLLEELKNQGYDSSNKTDDEVYKEFLQRL